MNIQHILIALVVLSVLHIIPAEGQIEATEARPLNPDALDIIGEFRRVGQPKYTDIEKRIIDRAQKLQDEHTAIFNKIAIGNSVFDYPGLLALGTIRYDEHDQYPYFITLGISPHISEFSDAFRQYSIQFDAKGIVQKKSRIISPVNKK